MADFELAIDLNLRTILVTTEAAIPELRARGGGALLYTASTSGLVHARRSARSIRWRSSGVVGFVRSRRWPSGWRAKRSGSMRSARDRSTPRCCGSSRSPGPTSSRTGGHGQGGSLSCSAASKSRCAAPASRRRSPTPRCSCCPTKPPSSRARHCRSTAPRRPSGQPDAQEISHRFVETNGIRLHVAEAGARRRWSLLCHGFPESWFSWRHQLTALAEAGFHAVAPDMRGYGQSGPPGGGSTNTRSSIWSVTWWDSSTRLGAEHAVIAGHDWGAPVAWRRGAAAPRPLSRRRRPQTCRTARADAWCGRRPRCRRPTRRCSTSSISRNPESPRRSSSAIHGCRCAPSFIRLPATRRAPRLGRGGRGMRSAWSRGRRVSSPAWSTRHRCRRGSSDADIDFYAAEFARSGFRGGLNWYPAAASTRNWELLAPFAGARVTIPALYIAGDPRPRRRTFAAWISCLPNLAKFVPQLRQTIMLPGCGHWTQQERAAEVNAAMIDFPARALGWSRKTRSFRGAAEGCEPGTHIPEACVPGFRVRRCAAPRNDPLFFLFPCEGSAARRRGIASPWRK